MANSLPWEKIFSRKEKRETNNFSLWLFGQPFKESHQGIKLKLNKSKE